MKDVEEKIRPLFDGYLRKPVSKKLLIGELKKFLPYTAVDPNKECVQEIDTMQVVSEISEEQRVEIIQTLNAMLPEWEEISDTFFIDDIAAFADKIREIARKYNSEILTDYGTALCDTAQSNNLGDMEKRMADFPGLISNI
jgi:hypothetical protein